MVASVCTSAAFFSAMILSYLVIGMSFCSMIVVFGELDGHLGTVELADRVIDVEFAVGGGSILIGDCSFHFQVGAQRSTVVLLAWAMSFWKCLSVRATSTECICAYRHSAPSRCV